jgi:hypothetical protein
MNTIHFVVTVRTNSGDKFTYDAIGPSSCDLVEAALLTFGICAVTVTPA